LVVNSIDVVRADGFLEVLQRFQVGYLFESEQIIIEEIDSSSRPSFKLIDLDSDRFGVNSSEVDCGNTINNALANSK